MKREYFRDFGLATAVIIPHRDGTATLRAKTINGVRIHNKVHKSRDAAYRAWRRLCE